MMTNEQILHAAAKLSALVKVLDEAPDQEPKLGPEMDAVIDQFRDDGDGVALLRLAQAMLEGRGYEIHSAGSLSRYRSLAAHMGATIEEGESPWGKLLHRLMILPPEKH
jgi:hypothetical protein